MSLILPQRGRIRQAAAGGGGPSIALTDNQSDAVDRSTYTFSGLLFGAEAADRIILIGIMSRDLSGFYTNEATPTIDSNSCTKIVSHMNNAYKNYVGLYGIAYPTDGANDFSVTFGGPSDRIQIAVWRMTGVSGVTALDSGSGAMTSGTFSDTLTTEVDGVAVGLTAGTFTSGTKTYAWTNLTKDFDGEPETNVINGAASIVTSATSTAFTVNDDFTAGTVGGALFASWGA